MVSPFRPAGRASVAWLGSGTVAARKENVTGRHIVHVTR
jgi:hypothetical protein